MVCLIAASCGGGSSSSADTPQIDPPSPDMVVSGPVRGSVITDAPVAGAHVQLYTHDGQLLPGEAYTDDNGEFEITVAEARYGLRVVARGGATDSGSFDGTLSAYVEPFDAELPVPINPVTTPANRPRVTAGIPAAKAELDIAYYLGLDPGRSIRSDFRHLNDFNSPVFMAFVAQYGSFDAFVDELVTEALANPETQRFFTGAQNVLGASEIALGLLKGAASELSQRAFGKLLSQFDLGDDFSAVFSQLETIQR